MKIADLLIIMHRDNGPYTVTGCFISVLLKKKETETEKKDRERKKGGILSIFPNYCWVMTRMGKFLNVRCIFAINENNSRWSLLTSEDRITARKKDLLALSKQEGHLELIRGYSIC